MMKTAIAQANEKFIEMAGTGSFKVSAMSLFAFSWIADNFSHILQYTTTTVVLVSAFYNLINVYLSVKIKKIELKKLEAE